MKPLFALLLWLASPAFAAGQNIIDDAWATPQGFRFSGRLTEDRHRPAHPEAGPAETLYRSTRLLFASSAEGTVSWSAGPLVWSTRADHHGYWALAANQPLELPPGWHSIASDIPASSPARLLVHDPKNRFGIISDIDDTILISHVPDKLTLLKNSLTRPPETRRAVPGMAALYARLAMQNTNPTATPIFYLSASPRQLTDSLRRFLAAGNFPPGVLMLKEIGRKSADPLTDQQAYKRERIEIILRAFPEVRFALFGDDGERDPETYADIHHRHPERIIGIWIRRVHPDPQRPKFEGQADPPL